MKPLQKVAVFLVIIGIERGRSIISLMDSDEINAVIPEIRNLMGLSQEIKKSVWADFEQLGYEDKMKPFEALGVIRLLFNGSKISDKSRRRFF
ncbi:MAG: hypothetical protein H6Q68_2804 [Firmicutes bacterium]|nr:hypothetical protein [Bacillota bacterium]